MPREQRSAINTLNKVKYKNEPDEWKILSNKRVKLSVQVLLWKLGWLLHDYRAISHAVTRRTEENKFEILEGFVERMHVAAKVVNKNLSNLDARGNQW